MKKVKLLHAEPELRHDGTRAYVCVLMSPLPGEELLNGAGHLDTSSVYGLNAGDIIADGSVLLTPEKKYIAWGDNCFAEAGAAYDLATSADPAWMSYVVSYYVLEDLYAEQLVPVGAADVAAALGEPSVPEGYVFDGWTDGSVTYQPGDILPEVDSNGMTLYADLTLEEDLVPHVDPIGPIEPKTGPVTG